jgi:hypothetical protein
MRKHEIEVITEEGGLKVILELQASLKKYGPPHIFSYHHGCVIHIICDAYKDEGADEYIRFYANGQEVVKLFPGHGTMTIRQSAVNHPSMYLVKGKACFNVKCDGELFMEIFWPEGEIENGK